MLRSIPWVRIWIRPRTTMREAFETASLKHVLLLASLFGVVTFIEAASSESWGESIPLPWLLTMSASIGPAFGIAGLYIFSAILKLIGRLVGGKAESSRIRTAVAYGYIPWIWSLPAWALGITLGGIEFFRNQPERTVSDPLAIGLTIGLVLVLLPVFFALIVLAIIVSCKCYGEAQGFSAWLALLNFVLAFLALIIAIALVAAPISLVIFGTLS